MRILEESSTISMEEHEPLDLPPGFRFHPTDEELITHYLSPKLADQTFSSMAIGEVDLNKVEPWDLPWRAKIGEKEWYFFCVKDRKYPTGSRTNRATVCGYWKATGKDKEIYDKSTNSIIVGMKKTLVFYKGRAPKGEKTNWVMHEYRLLLDLEAKLNDHQTLTNSAKSEWVISRIFKKCSGGKKVHISGLTMDASILPPLMDSSFDEIAKRTTTVDQASSSHVMTCCFPNVPNLPVAPSFHHDHLFPRASTPNLLFPDQKSPFVENLQYKDSIFQQEQSIWRLLLDAQNPKTDFSQESTDMSSSISHHGQLDYNQEFPINSNVPLDLDILWNF